MFARSLSLEGPLLSAESHQISVSHLSPMPACSPTATAMEMGANEFQSYKTVFPEELFSGRLLAKSPLAVSDLNLEQ